MGKIAVGEGKGKGGGVGNKRESGVFFWSSRGKKLLEDEEKNKFCLPKALSIFFAWHFHSVCLSLLFFSSPSFSSKIMETTIPEPASPPSASTSFTSEEDCNDQNGGGKRDKALDLAFDVAASRVASFAASRKLADADALRLYGFYKQALEGDCVASRPAIWDRKGRAKW